MPDIGFDGDVPRTVPGERKAISPLFRLALASGAAPAVSMQLKLGAPINGRDTAGRSPLMLCAVKGHLQLCRLLLDAGADWSLGDDTGRDALTLASAQGHDGVVALPHSISLPAGTLAVVESDADAMSSQSQAASCIAAPSTQESYTEHVVSPVAIGQKEPKTALLDATWNVPFSPDPVFDTPSTDIPAATRPLTAEDLILAFPASADQDDALGDAGIDTWST